MLNRLKPLREIGNLSSDIHQSLYTAVATGLGYSILRESLADSLLEKFRRLRKLPNSDSENNLDSELESKYGELRKKEKKSGQKQKETVKEAAKDWLRDEFPNAAEDTFSFTSKKFKR